ncbi:MAG: DUF4197 domain-containing protein [Ekhidna sp.]
MKVFKIFVFASALCTMSLFVSCELLDEAVAPGLTEGEVIEGLKEALGVGLDNSVLSASSVDGYLKNEVIRILLPEEVVELQNKIQTETVAGIPLQTLYTAYIAVENDGNDLFEDLAMAMNRGAERAADKAVPIFGSAITNMSISDGFDILNGNETAATSFFYESTNQALFEAFNPDVKSALDATGANQLFTKTAEFLNYDYNVLIGTISPSDVLEINLPNSIDEYATGKAIDGLFHLVGEEEKKIRDNPFAWGSAIIEKVFGSVLN